MKQQYIDIMERTLSAYTKERIRDYIDEVKREGLTEHGFPRLGANIGILLAYGRRMDLYDDFIEIMNLCCDQMPKKKAANDFSIREVCCCLMLVEEKGIVASAVLDKWKQQLREFDPWKCYTVVAKTPDTPTGNWAMFAAVSEYIRGVYCGVDTEEFVDWELSSQTYNFNEDGMYKDPNNPMVYDLVPRMLSGFLLNFGYKGRFARIFEEFLDQSAELTLQMQSVTGEIPFGGRSNQMLHNDTMLCAYCEMEAVRFRDKGNSVMAGKMKAAAKLAAERALEYLKFEPISHVKNRYDADLMYGCEGYAYFNKYMITSASHSYVAALFADDDISDAVAPTITGSYLAKTGEDFHKVFLNCGGYFLEFDTQADLHYDANGLGRIHKIGCPSVICLSVPFPGTEAHYKLEVQNPRPMSLCCDGGAEGPYTLREGTVTEKEVLAVFDCACGSETYMVSDSGIDISYSQKGFMLPVFEFDGEKETEIEIGKDCISVRYQEAVCQYCFNGNLQDFEYYYNRNGRYRVYHVNGSQLHIEIYQEGDRRNVQ